VYCHINSLNYFVHEMSYSYRQDKGTKMGRHAQAIELTEEETQELKRLRRRRNTSSALHRRAGIILDCARGYSGEEIAERHAVSQQTVSKWRSRFIECRLAGLTDAPRSGQPRKYDDDRVQEVLDITLNRKPNNATHWSIRRFSQETGFDRGIVHRVWNAFGLKPHLAKSFKLSNDPHFVEKVRDVVGLYMAPPEKALVLCVDEKSQIQALDRTQPSLPMHHGLPESHTHDYRRFGTTTLFAALDVASGKVMGQLKRKHRSDDFLRFLRHIDRQTPDDLEVHLIMDNYGTHKTQKVKNWFTRHPRFHCHFTPTYSSWLNLVERFFAKLTEEQLRRGTHRSVVALERAIRSYLEIYNEDPKPFIWSKSADEIISSVNSVLKRINVTGH